MAKEEIRHCPRCGGAPKVRYSKPFTWVECKKCKLAGLQVPDYEEERDRESREMAIEDWNTMELIE